MRTSVVYPARAAQALGVLKRRHNDVEIFVEDSGALNMWVKLLQSYLPGGVKLRSVNVLGGRGNVIAACKEDQELDGRKKLYVIDGDLELLRGQRRPNLRHLYRLRAYCVENYLWDEETVAAAITTLAPQWAWEVVVRDMDFEGWFRRNEGALRRLFVCYAVVSEIAGDVQTVGFNVHHLLRDNDQQFNLCPMKVSSRIMTLYRAALKKATKKKVRDVFDRVRKNGGRLGARRFVSGKDYLFPPLYAVIRRRFKVNVKMEAFVTVVAQCTEEAMDPYLSRRLKRVCGR